MGMFDDLRCDYPLPADGANALAYQTKDTPAQWCELYVITKDGQLMHEEYDEEDQSDPKAEGLMRLLGSAARVNKRLVPCELTGEICFYTFLDREQTKDGERGAWVEWSSYFVGGKLKEIHLLSDNRAERGVPLAPASPHKESP